MGFEGFAGLGMALGAAVSPTLKGLGSKRGFSATGFGFA